MPAPHLYVNDAEIARIRENLKNFPWYASAYEKLQNECDTMLRRGFSVPCEIGYVFYNSCNRDNSPLIFDPYDPRNHVCPTCGMNYRDEPYQFAWNCSYHQWLAQMSLKLGICYIVWGDACYAQAVRKMLREYCDRYPGYANNDNELGSTRIFQSTYIESIWLSYIAGGYDMTCACGCYSPADHGRILSLFGESASVIRDYDEKWNNRQAFNNSGMLAAALLREDDELIRHALEGPHGFAKLMAHSVLSDGFWYEGDNYHFATVPSLVNMAEMCLHNGIDLYHKGFGGHTLEQLFAAPLKTLQPDGSFPSRKDSPYASTMSQRWYAGLYELAHRRYESDVFTQALLRMYAHPPAPGQVLLSAAGLMDVFENHPACREDLDWRGFLTAKPALEIKGQKAHAGSVNMRGTGLAVLRQDGGTSYLSVDYGHYGGGHGHPDRLAISWFARGRRWLTDYGTGNYYFDHLHWYRSTIGHNTVTVDGENQLPAEGECTLLESGERAAAVECAVSGAAPGVEIRRSCVLLDGGILLDVFAVQSADVHRYDYALHGFGTLNMADARACEALTGEAYAFLHDWQAAQTALAAFSTDNAQMRVHFPTDEKLCQARAYGPPTQIPSLFPVLIRSRKGKQTTFTAVLEDVPAGAPPRVLALETSDGGACIRLTDGGWIRVRLKDGVCVTWGHGDTAEVFEAFHARRVEGVCSFAIAPEAVKGRREKDGRWQMEVRGLYGVAKPETALNMAGQKPSLAAELTDDRVFAGGKTKLLFRVANGTDVPVTLTEADFSAGDNISVRVEPVTLPGGACRDVTVEVLASDGGEARLTFAGQTFPLRVMPLYRAEAYVDYCCKDGCPIRVCVNSMTPEPLRVSTSFGEAFTLAGGGMHVCVLPLHHPAVRIGQGRLRFDFVVCANGVEARGNLDRAFWMPKAGVLADVFDHFEADFVLEDAGHVARVEKRWQGPDDLSAKAMLLCTESSLALRLRVKDDCVCFTGGKFPFDNDSVELFIDRRGAEHRGHGFTAEGIYGMQFLGACCGNVSRVRPLRGSMCAPEKIAVSMEARTDGYELIADIPFACLGGKPEAGAVWGFDLLVNDRDSGVRRDLQLIWSGCVEADERLYLREDHHDPRRFGWICLNGNAGKEEGK